MVRKKDRHDINKELENQTTVVDLITALCAKVFQNYWEHSDVIKYVPIPIKVAIKRSEKDLFDDDYMIFFSDFLYKGICCGYSFELHRQVDAIQMRTHNIMPL